MPQTIRGAPAGVKGRLIRAIARKCSALLFGVEGGREPDCLFFDERARRLCVTDQDDKGSDPGKPRIDQFRSAVAQEFPNARDGESHLR